jgi:hypothetical protein
MYELFQLLVIPKAEVELPLHILHNIRLLKKRDWLCRSYCCFPFLRFIFSLVVPSPKGHDSPLRLYHIKIGRKKDAGNKANCCVSEGNRLTPCQDSCAPLLLWFLLLGLHTDLTSPGA